MTVRRPSGGLILPYYVRKLIPALQGVFGEALVILNFDEGYLNFQVNGLVPAAVMTRMNEKQLEIFGPDAWKYQVLAAWDAKVGNTVSIKFCGFVHDIGKFATGFNYY